MKFDLISTRNRMRVLAAVAAVALMGGAGSAWADIDLEGSNDTTGFDSTNENTYTIDDTVDLDLVNDATADNLVDLTVDSGGNDVNENTTVGDVEGGDIDIEGEFVTELNNAELELDDMELGDVSADFSNDTTGADSTNENTLDLTRDLDVDITNDAEITNDFTMDITTGGNDTNRNTTVGDVSTGDVDMNIEVENAANQSMADMTWPSMGSSDVDADFSNETTGADSTNTNTATITDTRTVTVTNTATVDNDLDLTVDSGGNDTNRNTTVGDVSTGDVSIDFSFTNVLN
ncbi:hypothetical protein HY374_01995 [Candidatus Berkelbacteria bacterium]|nr:hypothetical protein [Candidatus Berkelbacteria bacterium]